MIREGKALYETVQIGDEVLHIIVAKFGPTFTYVVKDKDSRPAESFPIECWETIENLQQLLSK